jgi:hypothetical protein
MAMKHPLNEAQAAGVLPTEFVTPEQTEALTQILDLALAELDRVAGGVPMRIPIPRPPSPVCQCVNCCSGSYEH